MNIISIREASQKEISHYLYPPYTSLKNSLPTYTNRDILIPSSVTSISSYMSILESTRIPSERKYETFNHQQLPQWEAS